MNNVIKFPGSEDKKQHQLSEGASPNSTLRNIANGVISAVYIVLVMLWPFIKIILSLNVALQFFKMLFKWNEGPFAAAFPFVLSFVVLTAMMYFITNWKPKTS
ncbi:KleE protein [Salmonella enterica]|nr:KleE protein [Salmonella enterica]